ncbi:MAG: hypothetical protein Q7T41_02390 [Candidatus Saccharibacteria bacterium]|nr:hypothetical protein [Candidatus Saccharibacteria bacterium]
MKKKAQSKKTLTVKQSKLSGFDMFGFYTSIFYLQSVLTVAHHTSFWPHDGTSRTVEAPSVPLLIISLLAILYSWNKKRSAPSILAIITITILATSSIFWLSGLRTNFYF